ncbi:MAG: hypothetical protein AB1650_04065, partial [Candidatus Omnitrophota bacterium]
MDKKLDIREDVLFVSADSDSDKENESLYVQNNIYREPPFQSRFKSWIRAVALALVLIFVPEQAGWAFSYNNPAVLWSNAPVSLAGTPVPSTTIPAGAPANPVLPPEVADQLAKNMEGLLKQIAVSNNKNIELEVAAPQNSLFSDIEKLRLHVNADLTFEKIKAYREWLRSPGISLLNCGVYSLRDFLKEKEIEVTLEQISISTLAVDILSNIIQPGEPALKTSLFAIDRVARAYDLDHKVIKVQPGDILKISAPFIASFGSEHFVTVTEINDTDVHYLDIGRPVTAGREDFVKQATGFVLIAGGLPDGIKHKEVSDDEKAYVWGNKYEDRSDDLPGLVDSSGVWLEITIEVAIQIVGAYLGTTYFNAPLSVVEGVFVAYGASQLASAITQLAVLKGWISADDAFILSVALSVAFSAAACAFQPGSAATAGGSAVSEAGKGAGQKAAGSAASEGAKAGLEAGTKTTVQNGVSEALKEAADKTVLQTIGESISKAFTKIGDFVTGIIKDVGGFFNELFFKIGDLLKGMINGIKSFLGFAAETVPPAAAPGTAAPAVTGELQKEALTSSATQETAGKAAGELGKTASYDWGKAFSNAAKGFGKGLVLGTAKGIIMKPVYELLYDVLDDVFGEGNEILKQFVAGLVSSLAAELGVRLLANGLGLQEMIGDGGKRGERAETAGKEQARIDAENFQKANPDATPAEIGEVQAEGYVKGYMDQLRNDTPGMTAEEAVGAESYLRGKLGISLEMSMGEPSISQEAGVSLEMLLDEPAMGLEMLVDEQAMFPETSAGLEMSTGEPAITQPNGALPDLTVFVANSLSQSMDQFWVGAQQRLVGMAFSAGLRFLLVDEEDQDSLWAEAVGAIGQMMGMMFLQMAENGKLGAEVIEKDLKKVSGEKNRELNEANGTTDEVYYYDSDKPLGEAKTLGQWQDSDSKVKFVINDEQEFDVFLVRQQTVFEALGTKVMEQLWTGAFALLLDSIEEAFLEGEDGEGKEHIKYLLDKLGLNLAAVIGASLAEGTMAAINDSIKEKKDVADGKEIDEKIYIEKKDGKWVDEKGQEIKDQEVLAGRTEDEKGIFIKAEKENVFWHVAWEQAFKPVLKETIIDALTMGRTYPLEYDAQGNVVGSMGGFKFMNPGQFASFAVEMASRSGFTLENTRQLQEQKEKMKESGMTDEQIDVYFNDAMLKLTDRTRQDYLINRITTSLGGGFSNIDVYQGGGFGPSLKRGLEYLISATLGSTEKDKEDMHLLGLNYREVLTTQAQYSITKYLGVDRFDYKPGTMQAVSLNRPDKAGMVLVQKDGKTDKEPLEYDLTLRWFKGLTADDQAFFNMYADRAGAYAVDSEGEFVFLKGFSQQEEGEKVKGPLAKGFQAAFKEKELVVLTGGTAEREKQLIDNGVVTTAEYEGAGSVMSSRQQLKGEKVTGFSDGQIVSRLSSGYALIESFSNKRDEGQQNPFYSIYSQSLDLLDKDGELLGQPLLENTFVYTMEGGQDRHFASLVQLSLDNEDVREAVSFLKEADLTSTETVEGEDGEQKQKKFQADIAKKAIDKTGRADFNARDQIVDILAASGDFYSVSDQGFLSQDRSRLAYGFLFEGKNPGISGDAMLFMQTLEGAGFKLDKEGKKILSREANTIGEAVAILIRNNAGLEAGHLKDGILVDELGEEKLNVEILRFTEDPVSGLVMLETLQGYKAGKIFGAEKKEIDRNSFYKNFRDAIIQHKNLNTEEKAEINAAFDAAEKAGVPIAGLGEFVKQNLNNLSPEAQEAVQNVIMIMVNGKELSPEQEEIQKRNEERALELLQKLSGAGSIVNAVVLGKGFAEESSSGLLKEFSFDGDNFKFFSDEIHGGAIVEYTMPDGTVVPVVFSTPEGDLEIKGKANPFKMVVSEQGVWKDSGFFVLGEFQPDPDKASFGFDFSRDSFKSGEVIELGWQLNDEAGKLEQVVAWHHDGPEAWEKTEGSFWAEMHVAGPGGLTIDAYAPGWEKTLIKKSFGDADKKDGKWATIDEKKVTTTKIYGEGQVFGEKAWARAKGKDGYEAEFSFKTVPLEFLEDGSRIIKFQGAKAKKEKFVSVEEDGTYASVPVPENLFPVMVPALEKSEKTGDKEVGIDRVVMDAMLVGDSLGQVALGGKKVDLFLADFTGEGQGLAYKFQPWRSRLQGGTMEQVLDGMHLTVKEGSMENPLAANFTKFGGTLYINSGGFTILNGRRKLDAGTFWNLLEMREEKGEVKKVTGMGQADENEDVALIFGVNKFDAQGNLEWHAGTTDEYSERIAQEVFLALMDEMRTAEALSLKRGRGFMLARDGNILDLDPNGATIVFDGKEFRKVVSYDGEAPLVLKDFGPELIFSEMVLAAIDESIESHNQKKGAKEVISVGEYLKTHKKEIAETIASMQEEGGVLTLPETGDQIKIAEKDIEFTRNAAFGEVEGWTDNQSIRLKDFIKAPGEAGYHPDNVALMVLSLQGADDAQKNQGEKSCDLNLDEEAKKEQQKIDAITQNFGLEGTDHKPAYILEDAAVKDGKIVGKLSFMAGNVIPYDRGFFKHLFSGDLKDVKDAKVAAAIRAFREQIGVFLSTDAETANEYYSLDEETGIPATKQGQERILKLLAGSTGDYVLDYFADQANFRSFAEAGDKDAGKAFISGSPTALHMVIPGSEYTVYKKAILLKDAWDVAKATETAFGSLGADELEGFMEQNPFETLGSETKDDIYLKNLWMNPAVDQELAGKEKTVVSLLKVTDEGLKNIFSKLLIDSKTLGADVGLTSDVWLRTGDHSAFFLGDRLVALQSGDRFLKETPFEAIKLSTTDEKSKFNVANTEKFLLWHQANRNNSEGAVQIGIDDNRGFAEIKDIKNSKGETDEWFETAMKQGGFVEFSLLKAEKKDELLMAFWKDVVTPVSLYRWMGYDEKAQSDPYKHEFREYRTFFTLDDREAYGLHEEAEDTSTIQITHKAFQFEQNYESKVLDNQEILYNGKSLVQGVAEYLTKVEKFDSTVAQELAQTAQLEIDATQGEGLVLVSFKAPIGGAKSIKDERWRDLEQKKFYAFLDLPMKDAYSFGEREGNFQDRGKGISSWVWDDEEKKTGRWGEVAFKDAQDELASLGASEEAASPDMQLEDGMWSFRTRNPETGIKFFNAYEAGDRQPALKFIFAPDGFGDMRFITATDKIATRKNEDGTVDTLIMVRDGEKSEYEITRDDAFILLKPFFLQFADIWKKIQKTQKAYRVYNLTTGRFEDKIGTFKDASGAEVVVSPNGLETFSSNPFIKFFQKKMGDFVSLASEDFEVGGISMLESSLMDAFDWRASTAQTFNFFNPSVFDMGIYIAAAFSGGASFVGKMGQAAATTTRLTKAAQAASRVGRFSKAGILGFAGFNVAVNYYGAVQNDQNFDGQDVFVAAFTGLKQGVFWEVFGLALGLIGKAGTVAGETGAVVNKTGFLARTKNFGKFLGTQPLAAMTIGGAAVNVARGWRNAEPGQYGWGDAGMDALVGGGFGFMAGAGKLGLMKLSGGVFAEGVVLPAIYNTGAYGLISMGGGMYDRGLEGKNIFEGKGKDFLFGSIVGGPGFAFAKRQLGIGGTEIVSRITALEGKLAAGAENPLNAFGRRVASIELAVLKSLEGNIGKSFLNPFKTGEGQTALSRLPAGIVYGGAAGYGLSLTDESLSKEGYISWGRAKYVALGMAGGAGAVGASALLGKAGAKAGAFGGKVGEAAGYMIDAEAMNAVYNLIRGEDAFKNLGAPSTGVLSLYGLGLFNKGMKIFFLGANAPLQRIAYVSGLSRLAAEAGMDSYDKAKMTERIKLLPMGSDSFLSEEEMASTPFLNKQREIAVRNRERAAVQIAQSRYIEKERSGLNLAGLTARHILLAPGRHLLRMEGNFAGDELSSLEQGELVKHFENKMGPAGSVLIFPIAAARMMLSASTFALQGDTLFNIRESISGLMDVVKEGEGLLDKDAEGLKAGDVAYLLGSLYGAGKGFKNAADITRISIYNPLDKLLTVNGTRGAHLNKQQSIFETLKELNKLANGKAGSKRWLTTRSYSELKAMAGPIFSRYNMMTGPVKIFESVNRATPGFMWFNVAAGTVIPQIMGQEDEGDMARRVKALSYQTDTLARGAFASALMFEAMAPLILKMSARTSLMMDAQMGMKARWIIGPAGLVGYAGAYKAFVEYRASLGENPQESQGQKLLSDFGANLSLMLAGAYSGTFLSGLKTGRWTKYNRWTKAYNQGIKRKFGAGEAYATRTPKLMRTWISAKRFGVEAGAFVTGNGLGLVTAGSLLYGGRKMLVDPVLALWDNDWEWSSINDKEAETEIREKHGADFFSHWDEFSRPWVGIPGIFTPQRNVRIEKSIDPKAMVNHIGDAKAKKFIKEAENILRNEKMSDAEKQDALRALAKREGLDIDKRMEDADKSRINSQTMMLALSELKLNQLIEKSELRDEAFRNASIDLEKGFVSKYKDGTLLTFVKTKDDGIKAVENRMMSDNVDFALTAVLGATVFKVGKGYSSNYQRMLKNPASEAKGFLKGGVEALEKGQLKQSYVSAKAAPSKYAHRWAATGAGLVAAGYGINLFSEEISEATRTSSWSPDFTAEEVKDWGNFFQVAGAGALVAALGMYTGAKPIRFKGGKEISIAGLVHTGALNAGRMSLGSLRNIVQVMAPLQIVLEGTSYAAKQASYTATNEFYRGFLNYTFAAFWQDNLVWHDGQWMDFSSVKYSGAKSLGGKALLGFSTGIFGYDEITGEARVKSFAEVPRSPLQFMPEWLGGKPMYDGQYRGIDSKTLIFSATLAALRPLTPAIQNIRTGDFGRRFTAFNEAVDETFKVSFLKDSQPVRFTARQTLKWGGQQITRGASRFLHTAVKGTSEEIAEQFAQIPITLTFGFTSPIAQHFGASRLAAQEFTSQMSEVLQEIVFESQNVGIRNPRYANKNILQILNGHTGNLATLHGKLVAALDAGQLGKDFDARDIDFAVQDYMESGYLDDEGITFRGRIAISAALSGIKRDVVYEGDIFTVSRALVETAPGSGIRHEVFVVDINEGMDIEKFMSESLRIGNFEKKSDTQAIFMRPRENVSIDGTAKMSGWFLSGRQAEINVPDEGLSGLADLSSGRIEPWQVEKEISRLQAAVEQSGMTPIEFIVKFSLDSFPREKDGQDVMPGKELNLKEVKIPGVGGEKTAAASLLKGAMARLPSQKITRLLEFGNKYFLRGAALPQTVEEIDTLQREINGLLIEAKDFWKVYSAGKEKSSKKAAQAFGDMAGSLNRLTAVLAEQKKALTSGKGAQPGSKKFIPKEVVAKWNHAGRQLGTAGISLDQLRMVTGAQDKLIEDKHLTSLDAADFMMRSSSYEALEELKKELSAPGFKEEMFNGMSLGDVVSFVGNLGVSADEFLEELEEKGGVEDGDIKSGNYGRLNEEGSKLLYKRFMGGTYKFVQNQRILRESLKSANLAKSRAVAAAARAVQEAAGGLEKVAAHLEAASAFMDTASGYSAAQEGVVGSPLNEVPRMRIQAAEHLKAAKEELRKFIVSISVGTSNSEELLQQIQNRLVELNQLSVQLVKTTLIDFKSGKAPKTFEGYQQVSVLRGLTGEATLGNTVELAEQEMISYARAKAEEFQEAMQSGEVENWSMANLTDAVNSIKFLVNYQGTGKTGKEIKASRARTLADRALARAESVQEAQTSAPEVTAEVNPAGVISEQKKLARILGGASGRVQDLKNRLLQKQEVLGMVQASSQSDFAEGLLESGVDADKVDDVARIFKSLSENNTLAFSSSDILAGHLVSAGIDAETAVYVTNPETLKNLMVANVFSKPVQAIVTARNYRRAGNLYSYSAQMYQEQADAGDAEASALALEMRSNALDAYQKAALFYTKGKFSGPDAETVQAGIDYQKKVAAEAEERTASGVGRAENYAREEETARRELSKEQGRVEGLKGKISEVEAKIAGWKKAREEQEKPLSRYGVGTKEYNRAKGEIARLGSYIGKAEAELEGMYEELDLAEGDLEAAMTMKAEARESTAAGAMGKVEYGMLERQAQAARTKVAALEKSATKEDYRNEEEQAKQELIAVASQIREGYKAGKVRGLDGYKQVQEALRILGDHALSEKQRSAEIAKEKKVAAEAEERTASGVGRAENYAREEETARRELSKEQGRVEGL